MLQKLDLKNRVTVNFTTLGRKVQELLKNPEAYSILQKTGFQFGFQDGGCNILALAFKNLLSNRPYSDFVSDVQLGYILFNPFDQEEVQVAHVFLSFKQNETWYALDSDGLCTWAEMCTKVDVFDNLIGHELGIGCVKSQSELEKLFPNTKEFAQSDSVVNKLSAYLLELNPDLFRSVQSV